MWKFNVFKKREVSPPPGLWRECAPSRVLVRCQWLSLLIADARRSPVVETRDLLLAVYACSVEFGVLCSYWGDWKGFEELIVRECGEVEPRLDYWLLQKEIMEPSRRRKKLPLFKEQAQELWSLYSAARELARPGSEEKGACALVTLEHLLLAAARRSDLDISRKLLESGLDTTRLEQVIRAPRRGIY
jgi:hypothetical protein